MVSLLPGDPQQLGDYWLTRRLGAGGQGVVYEAYDRIGHRVAVKVLRPELLDRGDLRARFAREAVAARRVAPFCTARVIGAEPHAAQPYIVSEYIEGPNLRQSVEREGPYDAVRLHRLAVGVATALTAVHRAGVVHRDLKPDNVLLSPDGPRVIDFGIARTQDMTLTTEGRYVAGTPPYMAPERLDGLRGGPPADIWAWGAVLLFAATGQAPFTGGRVREEMVVVQYRVMTSRPDFSVLPLPLRALAEVAMAMDPRDRPDARALLLRLVGGRDSTERLLVDGSNAAEDLRGPAEPSLAQVAERLYTRLTPRERAVVPYVLLRLVLPGEGASGCLRRAELGDLLDGTMNRPSVERVLRDFEKDGILLRDGEAATLTTAGLLRAWPRLRGWVSDDPAGLAVHDGLSKAVRLWDLHERRSDDLYQGTALRRAVAWAERGKGLLLPNRLEREFLDASSAYARASVRHRRGAVAAIAVLLAAVLITAVVLVRIGGDRSRQQERAEAIRLVELATSLRERDPVTAALLSVAAWKIAEVPAARAALHSSLAQRPVRGLPPPQVSGDARFDHNGRSLVVVDGETVVLWDVASGDRSKVIEGVKGSVRTVALSQDGSRLAIGRDRSIELWDLGTGKQIDELDGGANLLEFSPRGGLLGTVTTDGRGRVWDLRARTLLPMNAGNAAAVEMSSDDNLMAAVTDGHYELWDRRERLRRAPGVAVAFSPDGDTLAVSSGAGVRLFDLVRRRHRGELMRVRANLMTYGAGRLATFDGSNIAIWTPGVDDPLLKHPVTQVTGVLRFGPRGRTLTYRGARGAVIMLDISVATEVVPLASRITYGVLAPDARSVVVSRALTPGYGTEELLDVNGQMVMPLGRVRDRPVVAFSRDGRRLAVGASFPGKVTVRDLAAGTALSFRMPGADKLDGMVFGPDGRTLAISSIDSEGKHRHVELRDVTSGRRTGSPEYPGSWSMDFSPDGRRLAVNGLDSAVVHLRTGKVVSRPFGMSPDGVGAIGFSPDGKMLVTGSYGGEGVQLWHGLTLQPIRSLPIGEEPSEQIDLLDFTLDGKVLAAAGATGKIWLWDLATSAPMGLPSPQHTKGVLALAFSPDGRTLLSLGGDGTLRTSPIATAALIEAVCKRAGSTLSEAQWSRLVRDVTYRRVC